MIKQIVYLDCCLSDYFQGFSGVVLCTPVEHDSTWKEIREGIENDSNNSDFGIEDWEGFETALNQCFEPVEDKMDSVADICRYIEPLTEEERETAPSVYAYFGIVEA